jgi:Protein of unknown function (DUF2637)
MSDQPAARAPQPADGHGGLRLLALAAVALGVLLLAAAAFVLSYAGIHAVALSAGVSPRLARIYPLIFDAMLVVAGAAVLALRSAGLPSRSYAWLSMLALLAAAAAADALHATGTRLPRRPAAATAAVIPWALVLIGFGLLLCMLRHARLRRAAAAAAAAGRPDVAAAPSGHVSLRRAIGGPPEPGAANGERASRPAPAPAASAAGLASDLAIDAEPGHDDPASDEAVPGADRAPRAREEQPAGYGDRATSVFSPAPTPALADDSITETRPGAAVDAGPGSGADDAGHSGVGTRPAAEPGSGSEAEARPAAEAPQVAHGEPEAKTQRDADAQLGAETRPAAETEHSAKTQLDTKTRTDAESKPGVETGPAAETEPEAETKLEARAEVEAMAEPWAEAPPEAAAGPAIAAESEAAGEPTPTAPQFDRMRSSPVPPDA